MALGTPVSLGTATANSSPDATLAGVSCGAGDLIVVAVAVTGTNDEAEVIFPTSATLGSEVMLGGVVCSYAGNGTSLWYLVAASAHASDDLVVSCSEAPTAFAFAASKVTGAGASPYDKSAGASGVSTTPSCGATGTLSQADEVVFGAIGTKGPAADSAGTWTGVTAVARAGVGSGTNAATIALGYAVVSSTASVTPAKSSITSRAWAGVVASFKEAAAAPAVQLQSRSLRAASVAARSSSSWQGR